MNLRVRLTDRNTRPLFLARCSLAVNLLFALGHGALGLWSAWYLVLAAYYAILGVMRYGVLRLGSRQDAHFVARFCGGMLMALAFVLAQSVLLGLLYDHATVHGTIVMISLATYTFYKLTLAIVNVVRSRHMPLLRTLRNIACADAAASLVAMQRSMIATFGGMAAANVLNALTGAAACLYVLGLGISMAVNERKKAMAKSKLVQANQKIAQVVTEGYKKIENGVTEGYKKIESGVVGSYKKIEDKFVDNYLTREGETVEECKARLKQNSTK